jgi:hypothetical protein
LADYEAIYGEYVADGYLHQSVKTYFEEGGALAAICHVQQPTGGSQGNPFTSRHSYARSHLHSSYRAGSGTWANSGGLQARVVAGPVGTTRRVEILLSGTVAL